MADPDETQDAESGPEADSADTPQGDSADTPEVAPATSSDEAPPGADGAAEGAAYGCAVSYSRDQRVIHVERDAWLAVAAELLIDGWNMCVDVTAVDYLTYQGRRELPDGVAPERYEVVASFLSHARRERIRARAQVPAEDPTIESLYALFPGTDYLEREVFDLFGITFVGHPDMSRILMPETWNGHPLRKDYAVGAIPVQFKAPSN